MYIYRNGWVLLDFLKVLETVFKTIAKFYVKGNIKHFPNERLLGTTIACPKSNYENNLQEHFQNGHLMLLFTELPLILFGTVDLKVICVVVLGAC